MKIRSLPLTVVALLVSLAISEARTRRASADDGGSLSRDRGLAKGESAAVDEVLRGVTGTQADVSQPQPSRRYSPDYYRAYPQASPTVGPARKVAVAPQPAKSTFAAAARMIAKTIAPAPTAAPAPRIAPLRVAVLPRGMDRSGAAITKVRVTPAPTSKGTPLRLAVPPPRVATPPAGPEPIRVLFRD